MFCGALWLSGAAQAAERHVVEVGGHQVSYAFSKGAGRAVRLEAESVIRARHETVWRVLTDYEHLADVVPFVTTSRVIGRDAHAKRLYQEGRIGLLFFSKSFKVTFRLVEAPPEDIQFESIAGDFTRFNGDWHVEEGEHATLITHVVELEPKFFVPRWLLKTLEQRIMLETFETVTQRCVNEDRVR